MLLACPELRFTTGAPGGQCGRINDATNGGGTDLVPFGGTGAVLQCGTLYIGGGGSVQPPSPTPDGATSVFNVSDCADETAMALAASTSIETGHRATCTAPGCYFGPPLPIPNPGAPGVSTCVINSIAAAPMVGGTLDATTGESTITLPLVATVYVTGDIDTTRPGIQPCPQCITGRCTTGPNAGGTCTTPTSLGTTHDCPAPGSSLAPFGVDLTPLGTGRVSSSHATGAFCGATQKTAGAFGKGTARYIEENGMPAGDGTDGALHAAIQSSVFCIPASGNPLVDTVANLPGPGAITLAGQAQLIYPAEPPPCEGDSTRTIFTGGPFSRACRSLDDNRSSCERAWALAEGDVPVSCFYDASSDCLGCAPNNEERGNCTNTCRPSATSTTTTSSPTTSTTTLPPPCPELRLTTGAPGGQCGRINDRTDGAGADLVPFGGTGAVLQCGTLYIGGGGSVQPPSPTPDGAIYVFKVSDCTDETAMVLAPSTSAETGNRATCTASGCFFGPPLPIPNPGAPGVSTCVINSIAAAPVVGGRLDATTGESTITLPLVSTVYVTGDIDTTRPGIQPCPQCIAGRCTTGPNAGGTCTTPTSLGTTHDCPAPGTSLAPFGVDLSPLGTGRVTSSHATGVFCGPTQKAAGAFGKGTARYIEENGMPAGDGTDGALHAAVQASVFCIPASGNPLVDTVANLPGPGAVTLAGQVQLVGAGSPSGAFVDAGASLLGDVP
jgi:hypothetical protein